MPKADVTRGLAVALSAETYLMCYIKHSEHFSPKQTPTKCLEETILEQ